MVVEKNIIYIHLRRRKEKTFNLNVAKIFSIRSDTGEEIEFLEAVLSACIPGWARGELGGEILSRWYAVRETGAQKRVNSLPYAEESVAGEILSKGKFKSI